MKDSIREKLAAAGVAVPEILFPDTDLSRWTCVACDQFTSQPEYWEEAEKYVGEAPSSLKLMMPEAWLGRKERAIHEKNIPETMGRYLRDGVLKNLGPGAVFVKRETSSGIRRGLLLLLDLSRYEYEPGNKALCRATEATVEDRLPVRIEIRRKAPLEMPHVMVLFSDPGDLLMGELDKRTEGEKPLYDFDLMMDSGNIKGWHLKDEKVLESIADILLKLKEEAPDGILYAVGDGNHSLAAAKKCGDRYALVELVNLYDEALVFEPIHRLKKDGRVVDYIHGKEECLRLGSRPGYEAVIMPDYPKDRLYQDVIEKGVLPRKTFSMGQAKDKRFYLECCLRQHSEE
jgi:hypothetical protein